MGTQARLDSVQALRGLAACAVATMHITGAGLNAGGQPWLGSICSAAKLIGHFGVDVFFVISGLLISIMLMKGRDAGFRPALAFGFRRLARIYPLFWVAMAVLLAVLAVLGRPNEIATIYSLSDAILLRVNNPVIPVAWSLVFEVTFYIIVGAALVSGRFAQPAIGVWCILHVTLVALAKANVIPSHVFLSPISLEFVLGITVGYVSQKVSLPFPAVIAASAVLCAVAASYFIGEETLRPPEEYSRVVFWGLPASILLWAAVSWEARGSQVPSWLRYLGDISYSIYLWHWATLAVLIQIMHTIMGSLEGSVLYASLAVVLTLAVSAVSFRLVETPANRFARAVSEAWVRTPSVIRIRRAAAAGGG